MALKFDSLSRPEISCLIVDDEKLARDLIVEYLQNFPQVKVLDQCSIGSEAVHKINSLRPDLLFLDIEMPGLNGFEVLDQLSFRPAIVFVTAYDSYAVKAFEENASDYLLKPLREERFQHTIERILKLFAEDSKSRSFDTHYSSFLLVQKSGKLVKVEVNEIEALKACKDYTLIFTEKAQYLSSMGIGKLTERLNPNRFIRIHRSVIMNVDFIKEIIKKMGTYSVKSKGGDEFPIGRSYVNSIKNKFV